jgi:1-acyl-sn-glycerol-3-phosphate acyltransferase
MSEDKKSELGAAHRPFIPERPSELFIKTAQELVHTELEHSNHIKLDKANLELLSSLPAKAGIILTPNHADETDPRLCIELSRRTGRLFVSMCNREAFDEIFGLAGFVLQRLGHFSVERGAHDTKAKEHAVSVVAEGEHVVVIFPEGEIYYLNERVQPFHSGAVDIGMQALLKRREQDPQFTAFIVPMAIKYHYPDRTEIDTILARRITRMENRLLIRHSDAPMHERIHAIQKKLIEHRKHGGDSTEATQGQQDLAEEIVATERAIISDIQQRHKDLFTYQKHIIDETWQLEAELRTKIAEQKDAQTKNSVIWKLCRKWHD